MSLLAIIVLAILVLISISIAQVYRAVPLIELKRQARYGDPTAKALFKVAAFKFSSQFLLWLIASLASAGFFVLIARNSPAWIALAGSAALLWVGYIWIPRSPVNWASQFLAILLSGPICWVLQKINGLVVKIHSRAASNKPGHTGLYEKADVVNLLKQQDEQLDNRIDPFEIKLLKQVLTFTNKKVIDVMVPKRKVTAVAADDTLGPIVLDELHKSGQVIFPVYDKKPTDIVGVLDINLAAEGRANRSAKSVMNERVFYVHEEEDLSSLLKVLVKTHQQLYVVINGHSDYVGIVTAKSILTELVGDDISSEFEQHDNREAVARRFDQSDNDLPEIAKETTELIE